jgi:monoterpene epsilon-lactone hydrolase
LSEIHHLSTAGDRAALKAMRANIAATPAVAITREWFDEFLEKVPPADGVAYAEAQVGGVPGVWCTPASARTGNPMLYLHGGVFVFGSAHAYRQFAGQIAARSGVRAFVADYRRAPEHPFPAALDDARKAYRALVAQFGAGHVAIVGDSAGGGLALSLLREERTARCGVLLSPWTDLALTGGTIESKAAEDPQLKRAALEAAARQYLGDHDRRDPSASPLYAAVGNAVPIQVHVGTAEVLLDDSLRLRSQDRVEVHTWEDMTHVFPSLVGLFEAAGAALDLIATFLRAELAPAGE